MDGRCAGRHMFGFDLTGSSDPFQGLKERAVGLWSARALGAAGPAGVLSLLTKNHCKSETRCFYFLSQNFRQYMLSGLVQLLVLLGELLSWLLELLACLPNNYISPFWSGS